MTSPSDLKQALTADITAGFITIPTKSLGDAQVVANNIIDSIKNTGTPAQDNALTKLPQKKIMSIFETSLGTALGMYILKNKDMITDETTFINAVVTIVIDAIFGIKPSTLTPSSTVPSSTVPSSTVPSSTVPSSTAIGNTSNAYHISNVYKIALVVLMILVFIGMYVALRKAYGESIV